MSSWKWILGIVVGVAVLLVLAILLWYHIQSYSTDFSNYGEIAEQNLKHPLDGDTDSDTPTGPPQVPPITPEPAEEASAVKWRRDEDADGRSKRTRQLKPSSGKAKRCRQDRRKECRNHPQNDGLNCHPRRKHPRGKARCLGERGAHHFSGRGQK